MTSALEDSWDPRLPSCQGWVTYSASLEQIRSQRLTDSNSTMVQMLRRNLSEAPFLRPNIRLCVWEAKTESWKPYVVLSLSSFRGESFRLYATLGTSGKWLRSIFPPSRISSWPGTV